jgi:uncharacterized protein YbjT (DUF2867 family)
MKVVVFGATGDQGRAQVRALAMAGHRPLAVSRGANHATAFGDEVESVRADFADHGSLARAVGAGDAVFLNLPSTSFQAAAPLVAAAQAIAQAAKAAGSRAIVFNTSLPVPRDKLGFAAQDARHDMRRAVLEAGVPAVVVQPVVFLDNLLKAWAWPSIAATGTIVYPHAETLDVSWICHDDLAALMIAALERPALAGSIFDVGGPDTVRGPELARRLGAAWGQPIAFRSQSIGDFCAGMHAVFRRVATLEADRLVGELGRIYHWYNEAPEHPFKVDMGPVLEKLPVALTPIAAWAARQTLPGPIGGPAGSAAA